MKMERSPADKNLHTANHGIIAIFVVSFTESLQYYCNWVLRTHRMGYQKSSKVQIISTSIVVFSIVQ